MFEGIEFNRIEGNKSERKLTLLGLSTCSFCKKGKQFLDDNEFSYEYLYLDQIEPDDKKNMKSEFSEIFKKRLSYPTLILDDTEILTGFIRIAWEKELTDRS